MGYDTMHKRIEAFVAKANESFKANGYPLELSNWFSVWSMMYTAPGRYHWMLQYYMRHQRQEGDLARVCHRHRQVARRLRVSLVALELFPLGPCGTHAILAPRAR